MFLFATLLFHSSEHELALQVSELELNAMQNLERYLLQHHKDDQTRSAIELGNIIEIIQFLQMI